MKNICYRMAHYIVRLALLMALVVQAGFVIAANADAPAADNTENWENVSAVFTQQIGADTVQPSYLQRCLGLIVAPTGDVIIQTYKGVCISKDGGANWSLLADSKITGRCNNEFSSSIAYPYDGRMAFFLFDGNVGPGGISLDGGQTWKPFSQLRRGLEFADIDWNARDPQTIYGITHEPFFTASSKDGGQSWQMPYKGTAETGSGVERYYSMGVIDANTLARYKPDPTNPHGGIIELSTDGGQTWTQVATNYQVMGRRPVHYGKNLYWTTAQGVITTADGKNWTLTGAGAEGVRYGPYFGSSEQEFVVATDKEFLKTEDGGKTWTPIAKTYKAPDIFHNQAFFSCFGWDSTHNILYASGLAASVYRLKL
jgi:hypothetical protein